MNSPNGISNCATRKSESHSSASIGAAILLGLLLQGCWEAPPVESEQIGFRGVGMQTMQSPETNAIKAALNELPPPTPPIAEAQQGGPKAKDVYQNVQVLGELSVAEFTRTMASITQWVSPEQGCTYCHAGANFAEDDIYTKVVSRRMMQMTQAINSEWDSHVGSTGVSCLTCHRGKPVPEYIWFEAPSLDGAGGFAPNSYQQNHANTNVGTTSMTADPFSKYLTEDPSEIRVIAQNALPVKNVTNNLSTQDTENTYSLMIHMSSALGQNCTYCHNTRSFTDWSQSPPARMTAWHALQMVPALNNEYLEPLGGTYPANRLGPGGDAPKVNCTTCHQGVNKPFYGKSMLEDYPVWRAPLEATPESSAALDSAETTDPDTKIQ